MITEKARKGHLVFYANRMRMMNIDQVRMLQRGEPSGDMNFKRRDQMIDRLFRRFGLSRDI